MSEPDKPNGIAFGWQRLATDYPYIYRTFRVRRDQVRWPDGRVAPYVYIQGVGAVWIVPVTIEGQVILIRQFRYTMDNWCWEVPAGGMQTSPAAPSTWRNGNWPRRWAALATIGSTRAPSAPAPVA